MVPFTLPGNETEDFMSKTTWKVVSYYEGKEEVQDILVELITEKIRRKNKSTVENNEEREYNRGMSIDDLPGLAG